MNPVPKRPPIDTGLVSSRGGSVSMAGGAAGSGAEVIEDCGNRAGLNPHAASVEGHGIVKAVTVLTRHE
jgi:hypothetical protein